MNYLEKSYRDLEVSFFDHQLWVTLKREKYHNAFSDEMILDLCELLEKADYDQQVRVIIFKGQGKSFCAGGDIKAMENKTGMFAGESDELRKLYQNGIQRIPKTMEALQTPTIAMVNGAAIGAGCDFAAMCDFRIASDKAKFGETFCKLNLVPGDGGTYFLPRVIGYSKAMEMYLTGKLYSATEAKDMGLANEVYASEDLESKTKDFATTLCQNAPMAMGMIKKAMKLSYLKDLQTSLDMLAAFQGISQRSHDHFEGLKAFNEKRSADFQNQ